MVVANSDRNRFPATRIQASGRLTNEAGLFFDLVYLSAISTIVDVSPFSSRSIGEALAHRRAGDRAKGPRRGGILDETVISVSRGGI